MDAYARQATLFKALMHPARLAIREALREDEACVCYLECVLGYRQAYISQQLMILRAAGLVQDRRDGLNIYYHVSAPGVFAVLEAARAVSGDPRTPVGGPVRACSCPKCASHGQARRFSLSNGVTTGKEVAMLEIKVLGTGCAGCLMMKERVIEALQALGVREAQVELVIDERLIDYGLLGDRAPGLLINGRLAWAGSVPTQAQITAWLQHALAPA